MKVVSDVTSSSKENSLSDDDKRIAGFPQILWMSECFQQLLLAAFQINIVVADLAMIIAGCTSGWNQSLHIGIGEYLVSLGLCTLGYLCLALCVAEMAGIIAFSGGSFGYVRCTLSPMIGYLCGVCDLLQTVFYTATFVQVVSVALAIATDEHHFADYLPAWYLAVYGVLVLLALPGGRWFWHSAALFTAFSLAALLMYCLMNLDRVDFAKFSTRGVPAFAGSTRDFFATLQVPMIYYVGVDLITLFGEEAQEPQRNIPWAIVLSLGVTVVIA